MIIICEPNSPRSVHAEVNTALIAITAAAFPGEEILFIGDAQHVAIVSEKVARQGIDRVRYQTVDLPQETGWVVTRNLHEMRLIKHVFAIANRERAQHILFTAISSYELFWVKVFLNIFRSFRCIVIPHSNLVKIRHRPKNWHWGIPFWLRYTMAYGNSRRLRYLVLGPSIERELCRELPGIKPYVRSLDHPAPCEGSNQIVPLVTQHIKFGFLGYANLLKGSDQLLRLAREVSATATDYRPEFILIGHISDRPLKPLLTASVIAPSPDATLPRAQYDELVKSIHYAVYCHPPANFALTAAGSLLDAFAFGKPVIALRNPYFEYYFRVMGDIGYLCDSYDEVYATVLSLLREPPGERYLTQCRNIFQGRARFSVPVLASHFKTIWDPVTIAHDHHL